MGQDEGGCELIEITCPNGPRGGMRLGPCDDAIMFGPKAQKEGQGIFGTYRCKKANILWFISFWQRLLGKKVVFITNTDEHGEKIAATIQGSDPSDYDVI